MYKLSTGTYIHLQDIKKKRLGQTMRVISFLIIFSEEYLIL